MLCEYGVEYKLGSFLFYINIQLTQDYSLKRESIFFIALGCHLCDAARKKWSLFGIPVIYFKNILYIFYGLFCNSSPLCFCPSIYFLLSYLFCLIISLSSTVSNLLLNLLIGIISVIIFFIATFHLVLLIFSTSLTKFSILLYKSFHISVI